jgi:hypothetical protein
MKKLVPTAVLALALAACASNEPAESTPDDEARLAAEIEGRVAGEPVSCVPMRNLGGNRSVGERAIVFDSAVGSSTIYVNRPAAGCPNLRGGYALRVRTTSSQLCRGDIAGVFDPVSGVEIGSCALGDFTPYRRR